MTDQTKTTYLDEKKKSLLEEGEIRIYELCKTFQSEEKANLCVEILQIIDDYPEELQPCLLRYFVSKETVTVSDKSNELPLYISKELREEYNDSHETDNDSLADKWTSQAENEDQFYALVNEHRHKAEYTEDALYGALFVNWMMYKDKVPFFLIDKDAGTHMGEKMLSHFKDDLLYDISTVKYILGDSDLSQRTQEGSAILEIMDKYEDTRQKIALLSALADIIESDCAESDPFLDFLLR